MYTLPSLALPHCSLCWSIFSFPLSVYSFWFLARLYEFSSRKITGRCMSSRETRIDVAFIVKHVDFFDDQWCHLLTCFTLLLMYMQTLNVNKCLVVMYTQTPLPRLETVTDSEVWLLVLRLFSSLEMMCR